MVDTGSDGNEQIHENSKSYAAAREVKNCSTFSNNIVTEEMSSGIQNKDYISGAGI